MSGRRPATVALIVTFLVGGCARLTGAPSSSSVGELPRRELVRIEDHFSRRWVAVHEDDLTTGATVTVLRVIDAPSLREVDVALTITMSYRVTRGDTALVRANRTTGGEFLAQLAPSGGYPAVGTREPRTGQFTWLAKNIPAGGRDYQFKVYVIPSDGNGDGVARARGGRGLIVAEVTPSGPSADG